MRFALLITSGLTGIIALAFGLAAIFLTVEDLYGPVIAAFSVTGLLASISVIALIADRILARRRRKPDLSSPTKIVKSVVRANPVGAVSALAVLSFVVVRRPAMAARMARRISTMVL
ncbi:hypothetical protein [Maricaulis sp.]|uniref:hypothetical protein n=1 Tax=Maricaulis sp. TaxID=1486257 RepID=UPI003A936C95|tara:strand:+ start:2657 stop:3007 length:351 start_codon:yes stop_codon:yes gene_type:complete